MKTIPLTRGRFALVDDRDYARIAAHKWYCATNGYAARTEIDYSRPRKADGNLGGRTVLMHREVLGFPVDAIDHMNGNKLDNRRSNLRTCTAQQNQGNRKPNKGKKYRGVTVRRALPGRFIAEIGINGKQVYLGWFGTAESAAREYDKAALKHFGEFARLNFPKEIEQQESGKAA